MKLPWRLFDAFLAEQRRYDGTVWRRILGESQDDYGEACIWIDVRDREQAFAALLHLRSALADLYFNYDETKFTVSVTARIDGFIGYYLSCEGGEIFEDGALAEIAAGPHMTDRTSNIFDLS